MIKNSRRANKEAARFCLALQVKPELGSGGKQKTHFLSYFNGNYTKAAAELLDKVF